MLEGIIMMWTQIRFISDQDFDFIQVDVTSQKAP